LNSSVQLKISEKTDQKVENLKIQRKIRVSETFSSGKIVWNIPSCAQEAQVY
jgi:hypothetical protein